GRRGGSGQRWRRGRGGARRSRRWCRGGCRGLPRGRASGPVLRRRAPTM
ncbi:MAG: hypothetical protein AVDCRST_MAG65-1366, partial [uncultured Solirubrobacteraceae bacterium]